MMQPQHNQGNIMGMMNPQHAGPNATSPHAAQHQQNHPHMMIPTNQVCSALGVARFFKLSPIINRCRLQGMQQPGLVQQ